MKFESRVPTSDLYLTIALIEVLFEAGSVWWPTGKHAQ
jgi:hypothetical protein